MKENGHYRERVKFTRKMKKEYTILTPSMAPIHFKILRPILQREGYKIDIMENDGPEVLALAQKYLHNDMCYPSMLTTGQIAALNALWGAGSGFALGQGAILAALQAEDGSGAPTILRDMVAAQCKKDRVLDALAEFYAGGKVEVARYAPLVCKAYAQGDAVATEILVRNVRAIADNVRALGSRMGMDEVRVGLCGGLTAESDVILPLLQDALAGDGREYILSVAKAQPIEGALYLAGLR